MSSTDLLLWLRDEERIALVVAVAPVLSPCPPAPHTSGAFLRVMAQVQKGHQTCVRNSRSGNWKGGIFIGTLWPRSFWTYGLLVRQAQQGHRQCPSEWVGKAVAFWFNVLLVGTADSREQFDNERHLFHTPMSTRCLKVVGRCLCSVLQINYTGHWWLKWQGVASKYFLCGLLSVYLLLGIPWYSLISIGSLNSVIRAVAMPQL